MNIRKRLRRERRHETRQKRRRFFELYLLQTILSWIQMKEMDITGADIDRARILQQAMLDLHGVRALVHPLAIVLYTTKSGVTDEQTLAIAKKARRKKRGGRNRFWRFAWTSTAKIETLRRRARYRGSRKARAAALRVRRAGNGWRSATLLGATVGIGAMMYGALGLYGPSRTLGKVA